MPFRTRQKMYFYPSGRIFFRVGTPNPDTGIVEFSDMPQQVNLPDSEMTDLAACLKAGVSLEKTNCKLISSSRVPRSIVERLNAVTESDIKPNESNSNTEDK